MPDFGTVEDTLFVPMLGRIYASENFPDIFFDSKALELRSRLPRDIRGRDTQTEYTLMASAVRSINMDRYIRDFQRREPDGVVALLGAGLETTSFRNDNGRTVFYEIDLPSVIEYRKELIGTSGRDRVIAADAFGEEWIREIRKAFPDRPVLVAASGLFHYFDYESVIGLFRKLRGYGRIEILFDAVNGAGMKRMSRYMKQVGHEDASMHFFVDDAGDIAERTGGCRVLAEEPYYAHTGKKGLGPITKISMKVSDRFKMVKMVHLGLN